jgi:hypothetical protein
MLVGLAGVEIKTSWVLDQGKLATEITPESKVRQK